VLGDLGLLRVIGQDFPHDVAPQAPPQLGTLPRVDTDEIAARLDRLPHTLLGWVGADGLPLVARVRAHGTSEHGLELSTSDGPLPPGGRRAGLTGHAFQRYMVGQEQRVHTGCLDARGTEATYAPHTQAGYALPASPTLMTVGSIVGMRVGDRKARRLGLTT
jgi:hypothetical protein